MEIFITTLAFFVLFLSVIELLEASGKFYYDSKGSSTEPYYAIFQIIGVLILSFIVGFFANHFGFSPKQSFIYALAYLLIIIFFVSIFSKKIISGTYKSVPFTYNFIKSTKPIRKWLTPIVVLIECLLLISHLSIH